MGNKKTATFSMRMTPEKKQRMEEFFEDLSQLAVLENLVFAEYSPV